MNVMTSFIEILGLCVIGYFLLRVVIGATILIANYREVKEIIKEAAAQNVGKTNSLDEIIPIKMEIAKHGEHRFTLVYTTINSRFLGQVPFDEDPLPMLTDRYPTKKFAIIAEESKGWIQERMNVIRQGSYEKST